MLARTACGFPSPGKAVTLDCQVCSFQNPDDARYCQNCGNALPVVCPICSKLNDADARFCKNCGHAFQAAAPRRPSQAARRTLAEISHGERRVLTMLFSDITGSTTVAEQLDPEEWAEIMDGAFEFLIAAVERYDGTVARLMGDAVLAFFGAPAAHEDDPYRAVLAGLDMLHDFSPYRALVLKRLAQKGVSVAPGDFQVRIGVNTGLVVVGEVGAGDSVEYTAMGDEANLAARLQQTAEPGTIQISQDTHKQVAAWVEAEPLGQVQIRGKTAPVRTFRVIGLRAKPGRPRGLDGADAPLVGRTAELDRLRQSLLSLREGHGGIVGLIGEAGLGKSRLARELRGLWREMQAVPDDAAPVAAGDNWYEAASFSFEATQPYSLHQRMLQNLAGVGPHEAARAIQSKLAAILDQIPGAQGGPAERALQMLFALEADPDQLIVEAEERRKELFDGLYRLWGYLAARTPLVLVFEDIHWTDQASAELLTRLVALSDEVPILFLLVFRPDRQSPAWKMRQYVETECPHRYVEISLQPLSDQESELLVDHLLAIEDLPQQVTALIRQKAEGNPFFVEEIVRELIDSGAVAPAPEGGWQLVAQPDDIDIPDSVQALLVARMDRLDADVRRTLQLAAVIGRTFNYRVLKMIADTIDRLDQNLRTLQQVGMIREASRRPELEYAFHHVLTQEAAYHAILLRQRRLFHRRTGEVMEQLFADQLEKFAPLLAHHFYQAEADSRALKYLVLAAESAARIFANTEAIAYYSRALEVAERDGEDPRMRASLHRGRALAVETLGDFEGARADHEAALALGRSSADPRLEWRALLDLGKLWAARDYEKTGAFFEQALERSREIGDREAIARSLNRIGNWLVNTEQPLDGLEHHREAETIFQALGDEVGLSNTLDLLGMGSYLSGNPSAGRSYYLRALEAFRRQDNRKGLISVLTTLGLHGAHSGARTAYVEIPLKQNLASVEEALQLSREIGFRAGEAYALHTITFVQAALGQYGPALESGHRSLEIATAIEHRQWIVGACTALGEVYHQINALEQAHEYLHRAVALARELASGNWTHLASAFLASAYVSSGDFRKAQAILDETIDPARRVQSLGQRQCWYARAELALAQGQHPEALNITDGLIESAGGLGPGKVISALWLLRACCLMQTGDLGTAEQYLDEAAENALRLGDAATLWPIRSARAQLYRAAGRDEKNRTESSAAEELVHQLAFTIRDESLRAGFLGRAAEVRQS